MKTFKKRLMDRDLLLGTVITIPAPEIIEIFRDAGLDWFFIDLEHSAMGIKEAQMLMQVAGKNFPCLVRVPSKEEAWIKKALDIGASGIILPQVKTAKQAKRAVSMCKYPTKGERSVGIARAHDYGNNFKEYVANANQEIAVVIQIEHINAVENIEKILQVPGIDCVFVGPYDLSASMGKTGQTTDMEVQKAISQITEATKRADISLGIFGANTKATQPYIKQGYSLIAVGIDSMLIGNVAQQVVTKFKIDK